MYTHNCQLCCVYGVHNFATDSENYIYYVSAPEKFEVVPGDGDVCWSVNGEQCKHKVKFSVISQ